MPSGYDYMLTYELARELTGSTALDAVEATRLADMVRTWRKERECAAVEQALAGLVLMLATQSFNTTRPPMRAQVKAVSWSDLQLALEHIRSGT